VILHTANLAIQKVSSYFVSSNHHLRSEEICFIDLDFKKAY